MLLLFLFAFILRILYSLYSNFYINFPAHNLYFELAGQIIEQGKIFYETNHPYYDIVGPMLPWINSLTFLIFGENWLGLFLISSIISAFITVFVFKTALLILDKGSAIFAAFWSGIYPFFIMYSASAGKDIWLSFFFIWMIYNLIIMFLKDGFSNNRFIIFIVVLAFSILLDERFAVFVPFIFLFILYQETDKFKRLKLTKSVQFIIILTVLLMPWQIRNYYKYQKIVIVSTRTERITDKFFGYEQRENILDEAYTLKSEFYIHDYQLDSVISGSKTITDYGYPIKEEQRYTMADGHLPYAFSPLEAFWSRLQALYKPAQFKGIYQRSGYFYYKRSLSHNLISLIFYGIILVFLIPGFYLIAKSDRKVVICFGSAIVIYTVIHLLFIPYTNWRYRLPLDTIIIIVGSYGMLRVVKRIISGKMKLI